MIQWNDVLTYANNQNPTPDTIVRKSDSEWAAILPEEVYRITRLKGTERPHSSEMCTSFEPGKYACACCGTLLFDATEKFDSGTGWPSFTQPAKKNSIAYVADHSHGMTRIETICNTCHAHLGHVFPDGPAPSGLRYCINALALTKADGNTTEMAIFGGGCFWCTHALFEQVNGVIGVRSGYCGGHTQNPTYNEICTGTTGHAEVIEVVYDPSQISFGELIEMHMSTHNPTTLNRQGADRGTQYRSIVFYKTEEERTSALSVIDTMQQLYDAPIVTSVEPLMHFYPAEEYHQDYYSENPNKQYCAVVIEPKIAKFRSKFAERLKK